MYRLKIRGLSIETDTANEFANVLKMFGFFENKLIRFIFKHLKWLVKPQSKEVQKCNGDQGYREQYHGQHLPGRGLKKAQKATQPNRAEA